MRADELLDIAERDLKAARDRFSRTGDERVQAQELLTHALGHEPDDDEQVPAGVRRRFQGYVARRCTGEPLPYIRGYTEFRGLQLRVRAGSFIPRATTEFLAEQAVRRLRRRSSPIAVDVACGIGPVALSVAHEVPRAQVHATDLSADAVRLGRRNAELLGIRNVTFHRGDLFGALPRDVAGNVDVITAHPPYVARNEIRELPAELKTYEPHTALTDSKDGLWLAGRVITEGFSDWLRPGGWLCMEIGAYLARTVRASFARAGYRDVASTQGDLRYTRVIVGRR